MARSSIAASSQQINFGYHAALDSLAALTVCGWFRFTAHTDYSYVCGNLDTTGANGWSLQQSGGGLGGTDDILVTVRNAGVLGIGNTSDDSIVLNTWFWAAMIYDGSLSGDAARLKLYIDDTQKTLQFLVNPVPASIGASADDICLFYPEHATESYSSVEVEDLKLFNVALTPTEVAGLRRGRMARRANLKLWPVLWGLHSPEIDLAGSGLTGTITNTPARATSPPRTLYTPKLFGEPLAEVDVMVPMVGADTLLLGLGDSSRALPKVQREDSLKLGLTDERSLLTRLTREESVAAILTDLSALSAVLTRSDTMAAIVTDASALYATLQREESLVIALAEDRVLLTRLSREDSLQLNLTESVAIISALQREDSPAIIIVDLSDLVDLGGGLTTITGADSLLSGLLESTVQLYARLTREEALTTAWSEASAILARVNQEESQVIGLSEDRTVSVLLSPPGDSCAIGLREDSQSAVVIVGQEAVTLALAEVSTVLASLSNGDSLSTGLTDLLTAIVTTLNREDVPGVILIEDAAVFASLATTETIVLGLTEQGVLVQMGLAQLGTVLIATVLNLTPGRAADVMGVKGASYLGAIQSVTFTAQSLNLLARREIQYLGSLRTAVLV